MGRDLEAFFDALRVLLEPFETFFREFISCVYKVCRICHQETPLAPRYVSQIQSRKQGVKGDEDCSRERPRERPRERALPAANA